MVETSKAKEVGIGGAIAIGVLYVVFSFLTDIGVFTNSATAAPSVKMAAEVEDLHRWHDRRDIDGAFRWDVPRSLEPAIVNLTEAVQAQTRVLERLEYKFEQTQGGM